MKLKKNETISDVEFEEEQISTLYDEEEVSDDIYENAIEELREYSKNMELKSSVDDVLETFSNWCFDDLHSL